MKNDKSLLTSQECSQKERQQFIETAQEILNALSKLSDLRECNTVIKQLETSLNCLAGTIAIIFDLAEEKINSSIFPDLFPAFIEMVKNSYEKP